MKKAKRPRPEIEKDRMRLRVLTRESFDGIWFPNEVLPEHVCGYDLGLLIEVDRRKSAVCVEEYRSGEFFRSCCFTVPSDPPAPDLVSLMMEP
jgi:hypothetical protein